MSRSFLGHISRRTVTTTLIAFAALIVLFFALTRTQVGRDELARQIESSFDENFAGSLQIGRLTGNIRQDLYAVDVKISDPEGASVLTIDSVVVRPQWSSLLRRRFSVHEVTLFKPDVRVTWDSTNQSSVMRALRRTERPLPTASADDSTNRSSLEDTAPAVLLTTTDWALSNATLNFVDGTLKTVDLDAPDSLSHVRSNGFDARNLDIAGIQLATIIDWEASSRQVDVVKLSASLAQPSIDIVEGLAQFRVQSDRILLNGGFIKSSFSTVSIKGFLGTNLQGLMIKDVPFQLEIEPSDIDFDEIALLFPTSLLRGKGRVETHIDGPLSDMTVAWASLESGNSRFEGSGTFKGLPEDLEVDLSISNTRFRAEDLRTLLPDERILKDFLVDADDVQLYASGSLSGLTSENPQLDTRSTFDINSTGGLISGTLSLQGAWQDSLHHELSTRLEAFDVRQWTNRARFQSSISGLVTASGMTVGQNDVLSHVEGRFNDVTWINRAADSISVSLDLTPESLSGNVSLSNGNGLIASQGSLSLDGTRSLQSTTRLDLVDVGPLLGRSEMQSRISAEITAEASLYWDQRFTASIDVGVEDSYLRIAEGESNVPAHRLHAEIQTPSAVGPVLSFTSDMFDVSMDGDLSLPSFVSLSRAWINGIQVSLDEEQNKLLYSSTASNDISAELQLGALLAFDRAADRLPQTSTSSASTIRVTLHDGKLLSQLSPSFPEISGDGVLRADLNWSTDSLHLDLDLSSNYFSKGGTRISHGITRAQIATSRTASILDGLSLDLQSGADTLVLGDIEWVNNRLAVGIENNRGWIDFDGDGAARLDSIIVRAELQRSEIANSLRFTEANISTDEGAWELQSPATFGFYGDATTLDELEMRYLDGGSPTVQTIRAGGTLSSRPADSLALHMEDLLLLPLSSFLDFSRPVGGFLNADFVVSGGLAQPRFNGSLELQQLSLDERLLGNVSFTSNYVATRPEVTVDLHIDPVANFDNPVLFGTSIPAVIVPNELRLSGDIRLPGSGGNDPGSLNLDLNVDRGDVFLLQYIFSEVLEDVSGFLSGSGRISGTFYRPEFDLDLGVLDGQFYIPKTQASYFVDGSIRLDREAIRFTRLNVSDGGRGSGVITGSLLFNDYSRFTLDVDGTLSDLQIMNIGDSEILPFYGFIWASGDLQLQGPLFDARLTSTNASTHPDSELFIPISEDRSETDEAFIVFEDSIGVIPDFDRLVSRSSILQRRPTSERQFLDGLSLDLNINAPSGSTVHLVIDPLLGDVINAVSTGNVQLILENDEFQVFGRLDVTSGDYQFTAGELFIRTFLINPGGSIVWNGDPINAELDIPASYRTRASRTGLPGAEGERSGVIPLIVGLQIDGTVESPEVELSLSIDRTNQNVLGDYQALEAQLNQPDRSTEFATSVLILNSFQLTTENITTDSGGQLAFNSVSQLVSAQLNRFLDAALPNVDFSFGLQGESAQDLDVTYGVALRFLNERLIIRGEGIYQGTRSSDNVRRNDGLQGEFVVEIRIGPRVSVEVFFRRESDILETTELTNTAGLGLSYQREFESFRSLLRRDLTPPEDIEL